MPATNSKPAQVFISYSHKDKAWLDRLNVHLAPIKRSHSIAIWDDTTLKAGMEWDKEIKSNLSSIQAAILLLSPDFLASEYIYNQELPTILEAAANNGATIFSIIISPCLLSSVPKLAAIQTVNNPKEPLINMLVGKQDEMFVQLAEQIISKLSQQSVAPAYKVYENEDEPQELPTITDALAHELLMFNSNPNRYLVVSAGNVYVQFRNYEGTNEILVEAVSNEFLPKEEKLSKERVDDLLRAGFNKPNPRADLPNYHRNYELTDKKAIWELAELSEFLLLCVYEIPGDVLLSYEHGDLSADDADTTEPAPPPGKNQRAEQPQKKNANTQAQEEADWLSMQNGIKQIEQRLYLFLSRPSPGLFLVVSVGDVYVQFLYPQDTRELLVEVVSNDFLPEDMQLRPEQLEELFNFGFQVPDENTSNLNMNYRLGGKTAHKELAQLTGDVMFGMFGIPPDTLLTFENGSVA